MCTGKPGLRACTSVGGNVQSCPPAYPSGPFYIGQGPSVTCDNCSCVQSGDCSGSMLHLYTDQTCGAGDQTFPMDGTCKAVTGAHVGSFASEKITPNVKNPSCAITPGAAHTAYSGNDFSVCCQ